MAIDQHRSSANPDETAMPGGNFAGRIAGDLDRLLVSTASGDQKAFRALYDATSGKLFAQAMAILRQRDAAEDVLQDGYVRIWERASAYDPSRGPALPWMLRLLRNVAIDRLRRDSMTMRSCDYDDYARDLPAPAAPIDDRMDLADALEALTPEQRSAVVTVAVQGWTNEQAGARAGMPEATSKARVARGLRRMRAYLELPASLVPAG
jgi:RNA polymerase sigma-70 factor (ECF subfamily)